MGKQKITYVDLDRVETDAVMALIFEWCGLANREENLNELQAERLSVLQGVMEKWAGGGVAFPSRVNGNPISPEL